MVEEAEAEDELEPEPVAVAELLALELSVAEAEEEELVAEAEVAVSTGGTWMGWPAEEHWATTALETAGWIVRMDCNGMGWMRERMTYRSGPRRRRPSGHRG